MSWFKNPWESANPWAEGTKEYQKWFPATSSKNDLELVSKPKTILPFHVAFSTSASYKGEYGFDTWTKEKDKLWTHVTYQDKRLTKDEYRNLTKDTIPLPYKKHIEGTCFLCLKLNVRADLEMSIQSDSTKPTFEEGDMFYIAANSELENLVILEGSTILKTVQLAINNSMDVHNLFYPIKASNKPIPISIILTNFLKPNEPQYISSDIALTIYFKKKGYTIYNEVGKIVFMPNEPIIVLVRLAVFQQSVVSDEYINLMTETHDTIQRFVPKILQQACIELKFEKRLGIKMDNSFAPYLDGSALKPVVISSDDTDEFGNEINDQGDVVKFKKPADKFFDFYKNYARNSRIETHDFKGLVILLTPFELKGEPGVGGEGNPIPLDNQYCILYGKTMQKSRPYSYIIYHELSHVLGLLHNFDDEKPIQLLIDRIKLRETQIEQNKETIEKLREKITKTVAEISQIKTFDRNKRIIHNDKVTLAVELNRLLLFKKYGTNNVMDYPNKTEPAFRTYHFWQWKIIRDEAKNYYSG